MFEKEAKEYADEKCGTIETEEKKFCRIDWQKGAEFGYNKAKTDLEKQIEKMKKVLYEQRDCQSCKYWGVDPKQEPCKSCSYDYDKWELEL